MESKVITAGMSFKTKGVYVVEFLLDLKGLRWTVNELSDDKELYDSLWDMKPQERTDRLTFLYKIILESREKAMGGIKRTSEEIKLVFRGEELVIPKGTRLSNHTATGVDPAYNFVADLSWYKPELTGFARKMATHDMEHYGINIDNKYVESCQY